MIAHLLYQSLQYAETPAQLLHWLSHELKSYYVFNAVLLARFNSNQIPFQSAAHHPLNIQLTSGIPDDYADRIDREKTSIERLLMANYFKQQRPQYMVNDRSQPDIIVAPWIKDVMLCGHLDDESFASGSFLALYNHGSFPTQADHNLLMRLMPAIHEMTSGLASNCKHHTHSEKKISHDQLTPKEQEILYWVRIGKTNPEIAEILSISRFTVRNHLHNICTKLSVTNRTQAALMSMQINTA